MSYKLYLDDIRTPDDSWVIARDLKVFCETITSRGLPLHVSFDHDLGEDVEANGSKAAKWLVYYCLDRNLALPEITVHTQNPEGRKNIEGWLDSYRRARSADMDSL
jgi:hypothetical protein